MSEARFKKSFVIHPNFFQQYNAEQKNKYQHNECYEAEFAETLKQHKKPGFKIRPRLGGSASTMKLVRGRPVTGPRLRVDLDSVGE